MINAPTTCYFVVKAEHEAASAVIHEISPAVGNDIATAILVSSDFDSDILAVNYMDVTLTRVLAETQHDVKTIVCYNALYIPGPLDAIDDLLSFDTPGAGIRFIGMNGNPFLLKTVEITSGDESVVTAKVEYRPFEMPDYSELVKCNANVLLN